MGLPYRKRRRRSNSHRVSQYSLSALKGGEGQPVHALFTCEPGGANREERLAGLSVRWVCSNETAREDLTLPSLRDGPLPLPASVERGFDSRIHLQPVPDAALGEDQRRAL